MLTSILAGFLTFIGLYQVQFALLVIAEFCCGALMLSQWVIHKMKKDKNAEINGSFKLGILGAFLDFSKGYFPLVLFIETGFIRDYWIIPASIAPVLGQAFSPFRKFKGEKAVAVTFGVWSAVTRFRVSLFFTLILALEHIFIRLYKKGNPITKEEESFIIVYGMALLTGLLILLKSPYHLVCLCILNLTILLVQYRKGLLDFLKMIFNDPNTPSKK